MFLKRVDELNELMNIVNGRWNYNYKLNKMNNDCENTFL